MIPHHPGVWLLSHWHGISAVFAWNRWQLWRGIHTSRREALSPWCRDEQGRLKAWCGVRRIQEGAGAWDSDPRFCKFDPPPLLVNASPHSGQSMLDASDSAVLSHLALAPAVETCSRLMPFHARVVCRCFYTDDGDKVRQSVPLSACVSRQRWRTAPPLRGCQAIAEEREGRCPSQSRAPPSLAGRRGWGGERTPRRRGPRQARYAGLPRVAG